MIPNQLDGKCFILQFFFCKTWMIGSHQITIHNQQKIEFLVEDQRFTMFFISIVEDHHSPH